MSPPRRCAGGKSRGLLAPAERKGGRRHYRPAEVRRAAMIRFWQETGMMSLDDIGAVLAGRDDAHDWHDVVQNRIDAFDAQIERLTAAKAYLRHSLKCPRSNPATDCPSLKKDIDTWLKARRT
nr:MerR family transcriptional regulator [Fodinicola feengrottensis]